MNRQSRLLLLLLLLISTSAHAQKWDPVNEDAEGNRVYVDIDSLKDLPAERQATLAVVHARTTDQSGMQADYLVLGYVAQCDARKIRLGRLGVHKLGVAGALQQRELPVQWKEAAEGTLDGTAWKVICQRDNASHLGHAQAVGLDQLVASYRGRIGTDRERGPVRESEQPNGWRLMAVGDTFAQFVARPDVPDKASFVWLSIPYKDQRDAAGYIVRHGRLDCAKQQLVMRETLQYRFDARSDAPVSQVGDATGADTLAFAELSSLARTAVVGLCQATAPPAIKLAIKELRDAYWRTNAFTVPVAGSLERQLHDAWKASVEHDYGGY